MGMAASQARYLALVARKSNCEFEGQQINQARTALSNQSANLFNQMLGLKVPVPPSTQDYTKIQYSYSDGINASVITDWKQIGGANPDYNYVVTHSYNTKKYTGSLKKLSDPQVQFPQDAAKISDIQAKRELVIAAENTYKQAVEDYNKAVEEYNKALADKTTLKNYAETDPVNVTSISTDPNGNYVVNGATYYNYENLADKTAVDNAINTLMGQGALPSTFNKKDLYFDGTNIAFKSDLETVRTAGSGDLTVYTPDTIENQKIALNNAVITAEATKNLAEQTMKTTQAAYDEAIKAYNELQHPTYVGNCELTPVATLTSDQEAELKQILKDFKEQGITSELSNCIKEDGTYTGGIYTFKLNGVTYYTTYNDLWNSYSSGTGNNQIDGQTKLPYYNATYIDTKIEKTERALVETDGSGRFTSIRFEDDSVTYKLNAETITDEAAYNDAMNQYNYENAVYDKMVQDINAKTSIIQHEDQQLELRLKQLDTEQNALKTEMEAVQKVVKDNVEKTFNTFGG
ncbi:MAG: hypothetical protein MJ231_02725 [bacterium]|nr:hypothetical protein [bacterium]